VLNWRCSARDRVTLVKSRSGAQALRETALDNGPSDQSLAAALGMPADADGAPTNGGAGGAAGERGVDKDIALAYMGLRSAPAGRSGAGAPAGRGAASDDPAWLASPGPPNGAGPRGGGGRGAPAEAARGGGREAEDAAPDSPPAVPVLAEGAESPVASPRDSAAVCLLPCPIALLALGSMTTCSGFWGRVRVSCAAGASVVRPLPIQARTGERWQGMACGQASHS